MKRTTVVLGLMVMVVAGLLVMAAFQKKLPAGAQLDRAAAGSPNSQVAAKGHQAPDFLLTDLHGHSVKLSDLRGKAVVLNFWATWCGPCQAEVPWFVEMQKRYGAQGLQIVGVSMDDDGDLNDVEKFAAEKSINYPILVGKETVAEAYGGIEFLPTTFYIDRSGVVMERVFGQPERDEIEQNVKRAIASKPRS